MTAKGYGIQIKKIKPPRFYPDAFINSYKEVMHNAGEKTKKEAQDITAKWKNKPKWHYRTYVKPTSQPLELGFTVYVEEDEAGKIFAYWELGTKRHSIKPKNKKALAFFWPKGKAMGVKAPMLEDGRFLFGGVMHPGTKAHLALAQIQVRVQKMYIEEAEKARGEAVERCGHRVQGPIRMR